MASLHVCCPRLVVRPAAAPHGTAPIALAQRIAFPGRRAPRAPVALAVAPPPVAGVSVPPPPPPPPPASASVPWFLWVGLGVLISSSGPRFMSWLQMQQAKMQMAAMQAMLKNMVPPTTGGSGAGFPGASGYPGGAGFPGMPLPPFGGPGGPVGYGPGFAPTRPPPQSPPVAPPVAPEPAAKPTAETAAPPPPKPKAKPFFQDAEVVEPGGGPTRGAGAAPYSAPPPVGSSGGDGGGVSVEVLEQMLEQPAIQKMIYPYLPAEMRNPESFKALTKSPMYRPQLEAMAKQMGSAGLTPPDVQGMMNFDPDSPEAKAQLEQMGMTPDKIVKVMMENPDMAAAFQNPKIQAAIMDCGSTPSNIFKYYNDPEIMAVFEKISKLFPGPPGMGGGMPGGMGPGPGV